MVAVQCSSSHAAASCNGSASRPQVCCRDLTRVVADKVALERLARSLLVGVVAGVGLVVRGGRQQHSSEQGPACQAAWDT